MSIKVKLNVKAKSIYRGGKGQGKLRRHLYYPLTRNILMSIGFRIGNYKIEIEQTALTVFQRNIFSISYNFAATVLSAVHFKVQIPILGDFTPELNC